jgi:hypothetical protein
LSFLFWIASTNPSTYATSTTAVWQAETLFIIIESYSGS